VGLRPDRVHDVCLGRGPAALSLEIPLLVRVQFMAALYRANEPCLFSGERVPWCVPCIVVVSSGVVAQRMLAARDVVPRRGGREVEGGAGAGAGAGTVAGTVAGTGEVRV